MTDRSPIYVEALIRAPLDAVWTETQDPARHRAWDLRFSDIEYLPNETESAPQRFLYATRIGFGVRIEGRGESVAHREGAEGERTSVLRFWSEDPKSLIREGGGYWRYVPTEAGVRFFTLYAYRTRGGFVGAWFDRWVFRPLLGWATAWSFDCLRLSLEERESPRHLWSRTAAAVTLRFALALVWIYQGLVPKLLFPDTGELALLRTTGWFDGAEARVVTATGILEIVLGVALVVRWNAKAWLWFSNALLLALAIGGAAAQPRLLLAPFNPVALTLAMLGLAWGELWLRRAPLPDASRCIRTAPRDTRPLS